MREARESIERLGIAGEVVVADNGSTDSSVQIAEAEGARVVHVTEPGYGSALAGGIAGARGRWVVMGDGDEATTSRPGAVRRAAARRLRPRNGNRFKGGIRPKAMPWLHRRLGNPVLSFVGSTLYRTPCGDIYCGLRGFDRAKVIGLDIRSSGMEYAIEMVVKATMGGLRVTEVPTTLSPDAQDRESHLSTWRDGWRSLRLLLLYSPRWLFLYPGLAFCWWACRHGWLIPGSGRSGTSPST